MVKAIEFAVRDAAGGVAHGFVAGDAGSNFVQMGIGDEISLNLARESIAGFGQQGDDLLVTLIDGRQIVLDGYFNTTGEPNQLYLSQNGEVIAVQLSPAGDGSMFASYGPADGWDKFSTLDDLRFAAGDDLALSAGATDEPAGMAPFLPGLVGLGGAGAGLAGLGVVGAVVGGGGGGGGGTSGPAAPTVDEPNSSETVTTETEDKTLDVSGTGEPGDTVVVTVGDQTQETTIGEDGTWEVTFPEDGLPEDGTHETEVVFTHDDGTTTTLPGPEFILDLTPPEVAITAGAKSNGDVENATEYADGVSITGTGEAGASIKVEINGHSQTTTVSGSGSWTVTFPTGQIPTGEYETAIKVTASDALGNDTVITDTLVIDTVKNPISFNAVTADNTVNMGESGGFAVTGTSVAGATLTVTIGTTSQTVTAGSDGKWSASFAAGTLAAGEYDATVTATSTDWAGNVNTQTHSFRVDTTTSVTVATVAGNDVVNATEAAGGVMLSGMAQAGSTVQVTWQGVTQTATVGQNGSWSATWAAASITGGTYDSTVSVTSTDAAGNTATTTRMVKIDTETSVSVNPGQSGGDDIVSGAEHNGTLALTGKAEAGATVQVTFENVTRTVTADGLGNWTASYAAGEYRSGTYDTTVTVSATDAAGNTATATRSLHVDTEVNPLAKTGDSTGADAVLNAAEAVAGLTVTGTVEAGSTVQVRLASGSWINATVSGGSWTALIPAGQVPAGESNAALAIRATDAVGNTSTLSETVKIDTLVRDFLRTGGQIGTDGILNAAETEAGLSLSGSVEPYSTLVIRLSNGAEVTTTASGTGSWSASFTAAQLPTGEGNATVTMTATDPAGNVKTITDSFGYDTEAPASPELTHILRDAGAVSGVMAETDAASVTFHQVAANGAASDLPFTTTPLSGSDLYQFGNGGVADGSYLVIDSTDAAGNSSATLAIVNNTTTVTVDLGRSGLGDFDFTSIDLTLAPQATLTITAAQLEALTGTDNQLMVKGGADDIVKLAGATATGDTETVDGQSYAVYELGSGTVLVDEDITPSII